MNKVSLISIRIATLSDASIVAQIVALAYENCQVKFKPDSNKIPSWLEWWHSLSFQKLGAHQSFIEHGLVYLILHNDYIIGTFRIEQHEDKTELDDFCILPQYQNKGYGIIALKLLEDITKTNVIVLSTPYFCAANRYLYTKAGYKEIGTLFDDTIVCFEKTLCR